LHETGAVEEVGDGGRGDLAEAFLLVGERDRRKGGKGGMSEWMIMVGVSVLPPSPANNNYPTNTQQVRTSFFSPAKDVCAQVAPLPCTAAQASLVVQTPHSGPVQPVAQSHRPLTLRVGANACFVVAGQVKLPGHGSWACTVRMGRRVERRTREDE